METYYFKLVGPWEEVKEKMKENNIDLTDEDLIYEPGNENELLERLQQKIRKTKEDIIALIESISFNASLAS
jgi:hypothetical protein